MLLANQDDPSFFAVGGALGLHHQTVQRCVERAVDLWSMAALDDRLRRGKGPTIAAEAKAWLASLACSKAKGLSQADALVIWRANHLSDAGSREPQQLPPSRGREQEMRELLKGNRRNHKEINRNDPGGVIAQGRSSRSATFHLASVLVLRDCRLGDFEPSFRSSPWMCGAPQSRFSKLTLRIRSRTSLSIRGRPPGDGISIARTHRSPCDAGMGSLYRNQHELICVFKAGAGQHANNVELGRHGRNRSNLWIYRGLNAFGKDRDELLAAHPTVKPVQLIADAIRDVTTRGDAVLDTFMGSGSTLMAAEETGRLCLGTELDPLYVDVAVRRWQNQTRQDAVHAETGELFNERALRLASESEEVRHG
jgi:hypothetical protein